MLLPEDVTKQQWEALYERLSNEQNIGSDMQPGTGTNSAALLPLVASVGKSTWPNFSALPFVGVEFQNFDEAEGGSQMLHKFVSHFKVVVVAEVVVTANQVIQAEDALATIWNIITDGAGHGLAQVLRNIRPVNFGTDSENSRLATKILISRLETGWDPSPIGKATDYIAHGTYMMDIEWQRNV